MRSELGAIMNEQEWVPQRGERVVGTPNNPTIAWRGRGGTFHYMGWSDWAYVTWDGNQRSTGVRVRYLQPELRHREW